jgi:predicted nucleic acid-binding protein
MTLIYVDTNVYMDYLEMRSDKLRPLQDLAFNVFRRTFSCEFTVVMSSSIIRELENYIDEKRIASLIEELRENSKVLETKASFADKEKARKLVRARHTPFDDTLHAVIAKRMDVSCLVTRNIKDFVDLQDIIEIVLPEFL